MRPRSLLLLAGLVPALAAPPARAATIDVLTWVPGSTVKIEQLIGDHDWADSTRTVRSRTLSQADVLGNGLGFSFESGDSLIFLFGDTIGATPTYVPRWASTVDSMRWDAHDPLASCRTTNPDSLLLLDFYRTGGDTALVVAPVYPGGTALPMGADDIPNAGIDLGGAIDLTCSVGTSLVGGVADHSQDSSVIVRFDPAHATFTAGRTLSRAGHGGHFVFTQPLRLPAAFQASPSDSEIVLFGTGVYRQSDIYLSEVPKTAYESGLAGGVPATRYFTGLVNGQPTWTGVDSLAVPVVFDDPLTAIGVGQPQAPWPNDAPTIGNLSAMWLPALGLWLMTFDGGRQPGSTLKQTEGVYFTYASAPWGPWMEPQLIANGRRDSLYGTFIHKYDHATNVGTGPAGPTIGSQATNDPDTTTGALFAPQLVGRFARVTGDTLSIDWTLSTWNPYTVVRMRSKFTIDWNAALGVPPGAASAARLTAAPNPSRGGAAVRFTLPRAGRAELDVLDVAGRRVRRLLAGPLGAGAHEASWDATDDTGTAVAPGLYFVRLRAPGVALTTRVARVR